MWLVDFSNRRRVFIVYFDCVVQDEVFDIIQSIITHNKPFAYACNYAIDPHQELLTCVNEFHRKRTFLHFMYHCIEQVHGSIYLQDHRDTWHILIVDKEFDGSLKSIVEEILEKNINKLFQMISDFIDMHISIEAFYALYRNSSYFTETVHLACRALIEDRKIIYCKILNS